MKCRIAVAKSALKKKKSFFTSKLDLNVRKKLVKCYIWSVALYGAGTQTLRKVDQKYLESFDMWCWRRLDQFDRSFEKRNIRKSQRGEEYPTNNTKEEGLVTSRVGAAY